MKISLPINQFLDDTGFPLAAGRISLFRHDSDTPCEVFTLSGDIYAEAPNPIVASEDGRIPTLFFDAAVIDVRVDKANGDGSYELMDTFQTGFDFPSATNDTVVNGMNALKGTNPDVGVVSVYGYDSNVFAPMRHYVWDPTCMAEADDGIVVLSDTTETGRWILLWDDEKLPCSVYGIAPGHESNISAFLTYPEIVSQWNIRTPRIPRFLSGTYTSDTTFTTAKPLYFDEGAKFTDAAFACPRAIVPHNSGYVADFRFNGMHSAAHSSWFRTIDGFWHCDAEMLAVDSTNYFEDETLSYPAVLNGKTITGSNTGISSYSATACIQVGNGTAIPDGFFRTSSDKVRISASGIGDRIFTAGGSWDPGTIADGHRVQFDSAPELESFVNTDRWISVMTERRGRVSSTVWPDYTLDLHGRTAKSVTLDGTSFITVRNATFSGTMTLTGKEMTLQSVSATITVDSPKGITLSAENSDIVINRYHKGIAAIKARNSDVQVIGAEGIDPCDTSLSLYGGSWNGIIDMGVDHRNEYAKNKDISLVNVHVEGNFKWHINRIHMVNCTSSNPIDLYPYKAGSYYLYDCNLENNRFSGAFRLWITYYWDSTHEHTEVRGTAVKFERMNIVDNRFDTDDLYGIKMTQWHVTGLEPYMYASPNDYAMGTWVYQGNTGNCPQSTPGCISNRDHWAIEWTDQALGEKYRKSGTSFYLWAPYVFMRGTLSNDVPSRWQDPGGANQEVLGCIHGADFKDTWARCCLWYANPIASKEELENEDYNNRFIVYIYMTRYKDSVPDWHETDDGDFPFTTFILPSTHA